MNVKDFLSKPVKSVFSLGQALTNACDMNCFHCYSRPYKNSVVGKKECGLILRAFPHTKEINFGTGETYLNEDFLEIFKFYRQKDIRLALTTNGNTLAKMSDSEIKTLLSEVDVSLDFPTAEMHDKWRAKGSFEVAMSGIERAKNLGLKTSIALAITKVNYSYLPEFLKIIDKYGVILRLNIYKPVHERSLALSYDEFWSTIKLIADNFCVLGISEPIISLILEKAVRSFPCGHSLRIHTDLSISGCVYLSNKLIETNDFRKLSKKIPKFCKNCKVVKVCRGGCLSRRILQSDASSPDPYCPLFFGKKIPKIKMKMGSPISLIHLNYLCTFLLSK